MCLRKLCLIYVNENKHIFLNFILTSLSHNWQRRKSLETNFVRNQFLLAQREAVRADKLQCHSTGNSNPRNSSSCTDRQRQRKRRQRERETQQKWRTLMKTGDTHSTDSTPARMTAVRASQAEMCQHLLSPADEIWTDFLAFSWSSPLAIFIE